jgi:ectoine hydroxylase-related dioxygenase (phytanoyl-CoA dioxygenase family)
LWLDSGLWIDRSDALVEIERRRDAKVLSDEEAEGLRYFAAHGYLIFSLPNDERPDALLHDVDRLWKERPVDLAFARDSPPYSFALAEEGASRGPRYRLHDIHSHSPAARALYLDAQIFRWVELILAEEPVAIQSLFFEYGSQQVMHRDPVVVPTGAPGHLLAAWIALEDISPDSGALAYVPGSHRLPYYEFAPGRYEFDARTMGEDQIKAALAFDDEQCRRAGLETRLFTGKKGEVLLWHASLRHGGGPVRGERLTRKSYVVHYSSARTYRERGITIVEPEVATAPNSGRSRVLMTSTLLEDRGRRGFENPMRGYRASPPARS